MWDERGGWRWRGVFSGKKLLWIPRFVLTLNPVYRFIFSCLLFFVSFMHRLYIHGSADVRLHRYWAYIVNCKWCDNVTLLPEPIHREWPNHTFIHTAYLFTVGNPSFFHCLNPPSRSRADFTPISWSTSTASDDAYPSLHIWLSVSMDLWHKPRDRESCGHERQCGI